MPRCVNEIEEIVAALMLIKHLDSMALDSDATLTFKVHIVKNLVLKITCVNRPGHLKKPVGKRALAMVYVCYYAEIAYAIHQYGTGSIQVQIYII